VKFIYLVPMGTGDEEVLAAIETSLWQRFGFGIRRLDPLREPTYAYDPKCKQYSSSLIVRKLIETCPADAVRILAVTEKDLFIPMLTFVFGQAQLKGPAAIVSLARLRQEFYQLPPNHILLVARALKEVLHEVGHTFGLIHCQDRGCIMSLATNIQQLDMKGSEFCRSCEIMLRESISRERRQGTAPAYREEVR
jgi:archaemetzincin